METLAWAREIYDISPPAREIVGRVFSIPGECLPFSKFAEARTLIAEAVLDIRRIGALINFREQSHSDAAIDCPVT
jgi:hypothetical protein